MIKTSVNRLLKAVGAILVFQAFFYFGTRGMEVMDEQSTWLIIFIKNEETFPACLIASLPVALSKPDKYGYTALYYAARDENPGLSGFLLHRGASKKDLVKGLKDAAEIEQARQQETKDRAAGLIPKEWPRRSKP